jgi:hypothetical protein
MSELKKINPANAPGKTSEERKRIPMSVPLQKLEVPPIPGYELYWFRGDAARIQRALRGGYEFVDESEVQVNFTGIGSSSITSGNTDMGSRVSVIAGDDLGQDGQPSRLILMKIKKELHEEDLQIAAEANDKVAATLRGDFARGTIGADKSDPSQRYVDEARSKTNLFTPKRA